MLRQWTNSRDRADAGADDSIACSRIQKRGSDKKVRTREMSSES